MHLLLKNLLENEKAIEKYKDRNVQLYVLSRKAWMHTPNGFVIIKHEASVYKVSEIINKSEKLTCDNIELHFVDELGEERLNINEFNSEDVYNCTSIIWDKNHKRITNLP